MSTPVEHIPEVDLDLLAPTTRQASDAAWAAARRAGPVVRSTGLARHVLVTRYEEVCAAFRDWEHFSSARTDPTRSSISVTQGQVPLLVPEELDPPEWFPMRRVLAELLTPGDAEARRARVRHWCDHYLDQVVESGSCDLVSDLVVPVPAAVTLEMLGFPEDEWLPTARAFHEVSAYPVGDPIRDAAIARFADVMDAIRRELAIRRRDGGDDAMAAMVDARVDGQPIDDASLERLVFMVIAGGVDTTTAVSAAAFVHLGRDHALRARLRDDPALLSTAVEEFLRMYPPARTHARTVTGDVELGGCPLRAGDRVVLSELSANYDEQAFPDPTTFQPERFPNRHVSFGMGIHRCPGSHLARIMFTEMLAAVLRRMPEYALDEAGVVEYPSWTMVGGWAHIPATFAGGGRS